MPSRASITSPFIFFSLCFKKMGLKFSVGCRNVVIVGRRHCHHRHCCCCCHRRCCCRRRRRRCRCRRRHRRLCRRRCRHRRCCRFCRRPMSTIARKGELETLKRMPQRQTSNSSMRGISQKSRMERRKKKRELR